MTMSPPVRPSTLVIGEARPSGGNAPLFLNDPAIAWQVANDGMDVFAAPVRDGRVDGPREFLFQVEPGAILPGVGYDRRGRTTLMAVGRGACTVAPLALEALVAHGEAHPDRVAAMLEPMLCGLSNAFADRAHRATLLDVVVDEEHHHDPAHAVEGTVLPGARVGVRRAVRWIEIVRRGLHILEPDPNGESIGPGDPLFPLAPGSWLTGDEEGGPADIRVHRTAGLVADGRVWPALEAFLQFAVNWAARIRLVEERRRLALLYARAEADADARDQAVLDIAGILRGGQAGSTKGTSPLGAALTMVGDAQGITFQLPPEPLTAEDPITAVQAIARRSAVGTRTVLLERGWWKRDGMPLLGFLELRVTYTHEMTTAADAVPVALMPSARGYLLFNPETGATVPMDDDLARLLGSSALQFYPALPSTPVRLGDLWRFVARGTARDVRLLAALGALSALLGLVVPMLTAVLFDDVIPAADRGGLLAVGLALAIAVVAEHLFELTRSSAVTRLHTQVTSSLQLAVVHRLIALPATFFRRFTAGDLGQRAMGIQHIGMALGESTITALLGSLTGLFAFGVLLYRSPLLTLVTLGILAVNVTAATLGSRRMLRLSRDREAAEGTLAGLLLELLRGVSKLRVAAAESRAFAQWSVAFQRVRRLEYSAALSGIHLEAFFDGLGVLALMATYGTYAIIADQSVDGMTTGALLSFSAAQGAFLGSGLALSNTVLTLAGLMPTWERVAPLLEAVPETDAFKPDPGPLSGRIELAQVHFAYTADGPRILQDVSLDIAPGSFVAIVGPSGSGKSTMMRLLLGFERPAAGSIRYDGRELSTIDVTAVRRQIGVVLQSATLSAGSILSNITGASTRTIDDAWEAARLAGLDADLAAMPMGLHTVVSEGGGTLSGGQRQRLLIARALVHRPRMLFFDEATSALDNHTQRVVSESLQALHATRVVIAHRLSTVRDADVIVVLQAGRIVEQGTYDELVAQGGVFADMAARQEV